MDELRRIIVLFTLLIYVNYCACNNPFDHFQGSKDVKTHLEKIEEILHFAFKTGIDEWNLLPIEPYHVKHLSYDVPKYKVHYTLSDVIVSGASTVATQTLTYDVKTQDIRHALHIHFKVRANAHKIFKVDKEYSVDEVWNFEPKIKIFVSKVVDLKKPGNLKPEEFTVTLLNELPEYMLHGEQNTSHTNEDVKQIVDKAKKHQHDFMQEIITPVIKNAFLAMEKYYKAVLENKSFTN